MYKSHVWKTCCISCILLNIVSFTPLVIPPQIAEPFVFGMPRTLWAGLLISFGLMIVTIIGAWAADYPEKGDSK